MRLLGFVVLQLSVIEGYFDMNHQVKQQHEMLIEVCGIDLILGH